MRVREKTLEKRNLEGKNPTKNDQKFTESLTSLSSTMVDDQIGLSEEKSDKPPSIPSKTSQFFRRFRLSAKTRSKYRNELRRSNSLLDIRSNEEFVDQTSEKSIVSSLDWLRRRKRTDSDITQKMEEMYVGNTLLKQKPRLRVRNANLSASDSNGTTSTSSTHPSRNANSLPSNNLKHDSTASHSHDSLESNLTRVGSTDQQRSDMEQVLYRAARLRRRRDRSKSNETTTTTTTRRSKSENHQPTDLEKNCASSTGSVMGSSSDHYGSSTTLHSTTAPLSEDSFLAASSARSYNLKSNPEQGSISTEYDPNSTSGSQDGLGESASSGYWSRGEKETDKDEISLKDAVKDKKIKAPWNIPKVDYIVNRVEVVESPSERKKTVATGDSSLFYVALVGENTGRKPDPTASGYRVRSGYTGRTRTRPGFNRTQSLSRDVYSEDESVSALEANEIRRVASEIRDTRRRSRVVNSRVNEAAQNVPKSKSPVSDELRDLQKFVIQPDDIKVREDTEKEEWKITIKISRGDIQPGEIGEKQTIVKSIPKKETKPQRYDMTTQTTPKVSPSVTPVPLENDEMTESPVVVKWQQPPNAPVIKTSAVQFTARPPLASRFNATEAVTRTTGITRKDVLPDLPVRERPRFHNRRDVAQNKFKNILSKWEDRINLSRTQSLDVINCQSLQQQNPLGSFDSPRVGADDQRGDKKLFYTQTQKPTETVQKLPPLDAGPILERNRLDSAGGNLTKYSSDNSIAPTSSFLNRRFSSTRNCSLPRAFGNIGGMGRHSYRPGCPIGWKAPQ